MRSSSAFFYLACRPCLPKHSREIGRAEGRQGPKISTKSPASGSNLTVSPIWIPVFPVACASARCHGKGTPACAREIVLHQHDLRRPGNAVGRVFDAGRNRLRRDVGHFHMPPAFQRREHHEQNWQLHCVHIRNLTRLASRRAEWVQAFDAHLLEVSSRTPVTRRIMRL